jgi:hypothetical protein
LDDAMIANALRDEIDWYAVRMKATNPLFLRAADGTLGIETIASYLANVRELLRHSPRQLARASAAARAKGDLALAAHFKQKLREEVGHDTWADEDLGTLRHKTEIANARVCPTMRTQIAWIDEIITEDPVLFLGYILFAEYLIVLLGPEWLNLLATRCNMPQTSMTVIGKHAELDRDHVDEAMNEIDRLVADPRKLRRMKEVVVETTEHFHRFCIEVCGERRAHAPAA